MERGVVSVKADFFKFAGCRRDYIPPKESDISDAADVCFRSKADVTLLNFDVRFPPKADIHPTRSGCLLWARSRHRAASFDHLVGAGEQVGRHVDAERLRGLEIDSKFVLVGGLHGQISRLFAL